jgi:hypothetical protein
MTLIPAYQVCYCGGNADCTNAYGGIYYIHDCKEAGSVPAPCYTHYSCIVPTGNGCGISMGGVDMLEVFVMQSYISLSACYANMGGVNSACQAICNAS